MITFLHMEAYDAVGIALASDVLAYPIGATIGSHTGPGTLALFFWGDKRID